MKTHSSHSFHSHTCSSAGLPPLGHCSPKTPCTHRHKYLVHPCSHRQPLLLLCHLLPTATASRQRPLLTCFFSPCISLLSSLPFLHCLPLTCSLTPHLPSSRICPGPGFHFLLFLGLSLPCPALPCLAIEPLPCFALPCSPLLHLEFKTPFL